MKSFQITELLTCPPKTLPKPSIQTGYQGCPSRWVAISTGVWIMCLFDSTYGPG